MAETIPTPMLTTLHTPPFCWLESGIRLSKAEMRYVAVSAATARMWGHVARIDRIIPNGIDLSQFPYRPQPADVPYLVWYGRIVPEKGLDFAIEAALQTGLPLRIAGPISDPNYYAHSIAPKLTGDITYVGHLDHRALAALVGGARASLCTPRWEEPYGLVVAEALACGTPIAAFRRGGIPDILDTRCGILANPDDAASLARAAQQAVHLERASCRARAEAICDAERMVDQYETLYDEMASPAPRMRPVGSLPSIEPVLSAA